MAGSFPRGSIKAGLWGRAYSATLTHLVLHGKNNLFSSPGVERLKPRERTRLNSSATVSTLESPWKLKKPQCLGPPPGDSDLIHLGSILGSLKTSAGVRPVHEVENPCCGTCSVLGGSADPLMQNEPYHRGTAVIHRVCHLLGAPQGSHQDAEHAHKREPL